MCPASSSPIRIAISLLVSIALSRASASEHEPRIFTNQNGVEIEAVLLEFVDQSSVRIRRTSDGNEFELPVESLSLGDQQYLAELQKEADDLDATANYETLVIRFTGSGGFIEIASGIRIAGSSSKEIRISIPRENWVVFRPSVGSGTVFLPYFGESEWTIEHGENETLWLTRDLGAKELVGVSLPLIREGERNNHREILRELDVSKVTHILNVHASRGEYLEAVSSLPDEIPLGLSTNHVSDASTLRKLQRETPVALNLSVYFDALDSLKSHATLECLSLSVHEPETDKVVELPNFPRLRHLSVPRIATLIDWETSLLGLPELRVLITSAAKDTQDFPATPMTSFAANPRLNTLIAPGWGGSYLDIEALRTAPQLHTLSIGSGALATSTKDFSALTDLKSLVLLDLAIDEFSGESLDSWCATGNLSRLEWYRGALIPSLENCPQLETTEILDSDTVPKQDFGRFASAPTSLQNLVISGLTVADVEAFDLPSFSNIEELSLRSVELPNVEFLYKFDNLENLSVSRSSASISEIDLFRFPALRSVSLYGLENLKTVSNTTSHPNLVSAIFSKCDSLSDFGVAAPNSTLRRIRFSELPALNNLDSFAQTNGIEDFNISQCDSVSTLDTIRANNPIQSLWIFRCANLSSESIRPD